MSRVIIFPSSVGDSGGLSNGSWTLVEFIADGNKTIVKGRGYNRVMNRAIESLYLFCFHGSSVEIDYILFD